MLLSFLVISSPCFGLPMEGTEIVIPVTEPLELNEAVRNELTQWAIHELIEQNTEAEQANNKNKRIMACLGVVTGTLSLTLVISEIIKLWS